MYELRPISSIKPYQKNPRINDSAVDAVAASIKEFGFHQPIVVDEDGVIIVGHTRYKAAIKLGMTEVPVKVAIGLSATKAKAYRIADNATAAIAQWDNELLPIELAGLQAEGFDLNLTGFSAEELLRLLEPPNPDGLTDPDDIPEPPDEASAKPGDLWILGKHRLLVGDSSNDEDVDRLVDKEPIHLINTDPPYNVKVEPRSNNAIAAGLSSFPADAHPRDRSSDPARDAQKGKPTHKKLRAKDRPLANDFVGDEEFERLLQTAGGHADAGDQPGRSLTSKRSRDAEERPGESKGRRGGEEKEPCRQNQTHPWPQGCPCHGRGMTRSFDVQNYCPSNVADLHRSAIARVG